MAEEEKKGYANLINIQDKKEVEVPTDPRVQHHHTTILPPTPPTQEVETGGDVEVGVERESEECGSIHITLFTNGRPEVEFVGKMTGRKITQAWRGLMRAYKEHKRVVVKGEEVEDV